MKAIVQLSWILVGVVVTWVTLTVLMPAAASAQTPQAVVSRDIAPFAAGANPATATPVAPLTNVPNSQVTCGLPKLVITGTVVNPTEIWFDDPADSTKDCQVQPSVAAAIYAAVNEGTGYRLAIRARGATTVTLWSLSTNPFDRVAVPPAVVTGVRVR